MDTKRFDDYQKRMMDAMQNPNKQSNDPFTKLASILENLKTFVNKGTYSQKGFRKEVYNQFKNVDSSDETAKHFQKQLNTYSSSKAEALQTISELYNMVKPLSQQIGSWSSVASIANECMAEIEKSIYNPK